MSDGGNFKLLWKIQSILCIRFLAGRLCIEKKKRRKKNPYKEKGNEDEGGMAVSVTICKRHYKP